MAGFGKEKFYGMLFVVIHLFGVVLCLFTLDQMWEHRVLLRLLLERVPVLSLMGGTAMLSILYVAILVSVIAGAGAVVQLLRTRHIGELTADAPFRLRCVLYVAMLCLCYCIFILSTPDTFSGPFRIRHTIGAWVVASLAYTLWLAMPRLGLGAPTRLRRWADLVAMNMFIALILAEIALRIAAAVWPTPLLITESSSSEIRRDSERIEPGVPRFLFPINSTGHYDTEFLPRSERSLPLVVSIGDSFSYGVVPHYYHYSTVAERAFPEAEIYNIGFPGTNPVDYKHLLIEEALPLEPDLIVIAIFVGNDIVAQPPSTSQIRWYDAQNYMAGIVWHRLQILNRAKGSDWTQESLATMSEDLVTRYPWLTDPSQETASMSEDIYLELESRNAYQGAIDHPGVYDRFFAALGQIEEAAGDIPLAFLIIPDEYQVNDELWQAVVAKHDVPLQRDLPQRKIRQWASEGNRDIMDLLPLLLAEEPLSDGQLHLYHLRDTHFNARGNEVAGRALAQLIEAKFAGGEVPDYPMPPDRTVDVPSQQVTATTANPDSAQADVVVADVSEPSQSDAATEVLRQFGTVISSAGVDGSKVLDDSLLKHPKDEIKSAIVIVLNADIAPDQKAFAKEAAPVLAFFQPGVGEEGIPLDEARSDQTTWRSVVEAEIQQIARDLASGAPAQ
ncbi:Uncharacterised protein [Halioglobus japonicus]|nr:Uncharacterised protein [Halioglobus japonicus]